MKKKKLLVISVVLVLLLVSIPAITIIHNRSIQPRIDSSLLTYKPLSRKLFDLNPEDIESISISLGTGAPDWYYYKSQEELKEITDLLNSFRYTFWKPEFREEKDRVPAGVHSKSIRIFKKPKYRYRTKHDEGIKIVFYKDDSIFLKNTWYYCDTSYFDELFERLS